MKSSAAKHAAAVVTIIALFLVLICSTSARAGELKSGDIIANSDYELGVLAGYGWAMDGLRQEPDIEHSVLLPSFSIPLSGNEMGSSFYRGIVQYQLEPVVGYISKPNQKMEAGLSFAGFKYNFTALESRWSPYSNFGFGVIYEPIGHHVQGSDFNFIIQTGVGVQYFLDEKNAINVQYRYRHISNASYRLPNSSINSSFILVGWSFF
ncbi:MAG TPA: acyloxyacyl hydrolase [Nitrospirota bacterium]